MAFGNKLRQLRLQRGLTQDHITKVLGYATRGYVSDVEAGKFIPGPDKLEKYAKALGMTKEEMDDLLFEDKLETLGLDDPGFTIMFKDVPRMTKDEKQSVLRAYEAVVRARSQKRNK